MAYKIYFNQQNAQHSFFSVKEKPWHEVGQIIEGFPTSADALTFAGLNYTVENGIYSFLEMRIHPQTRRIK